MGYDIDIAKLQTALKDISKTDELFSEALSKDWMPDFQKAIGIWHTSCLELKIGEGYVERILEEHSENDIIACIAPELVAKAEEFLAGLEECEHTGSKRVIPICGGSNCGTTMTEDIYICNDCGAIYLRRYVHWAAQDEEITDNITPGETKHGVTFHKESAAMLKLVQKATSEEALEQIGKQAVAVGTFIQYRLKQGVT